MSKRNDRSANGWSKNPRRDASAKRKAPILGIEPLEGRTLLAVTSQLTNLGVLDVSLDAANDVATVSASGGSIDVFDGTTHTPYTLANVLGINVHGTNAGGQKVTLQSPATQVRLTKSLTASQLNSETITGFFQAPNIDLSATEIHVNGAVLSTRAVAANADPALAPSTGNSGGLVLTAPIIDVTPGSKLLANASGVFLPGNVKLTAVDSQVGENAKSTATITVNGAIIRGGDIVIDASATLNSTAAKPLDSNGASIANLDVTSVASVNISGTTKASTEITGSGLVAIGAHSTATTNAIALAMSQSDDTAKDAAFAKTSLTSTAIAHIFGLTSVTAGGLLSLTATNDTSASTSADGSGSGSKAGGASVAIANVTTDTEAFADGASSLKAAQMKLSADSKAKAVTTAKSTSNSVTQNTPATQNTLASQNAKTASGPLTIAAALGVTTFNEKTLASLATSGSVLSTGDLTIDSKSSALSSAVADAATASPNGPSAGEGVSIAVQHGTATNRASIAGSGQVQAKGITLNATTSGSPNSFDAQALSGVSKNNSSLEGAAAFNISSVTNDAILLKGAKVKSTGGDVALTSTNDVTSTASAKPAPGAAPGSVAKGMGASFALNILSDTTRAEIADSATLDGAANLKLAANGHESMTTTTVSGAEPPGANSSGFSASAGISVLNALTSARIGQGNKITVSGGLNADATHKADVANFAGGAAAGQGVIGAALALDVTSAQTFATLDRDFEATTGDVTVSTHANLSSSADAKASAKGGKTANGAQNKAVDKEVASQLAAANSQATSANVAGTNNASAPAAQTGGGDATAAGALAIDLVTNSRSEATLAPNRKLIAGGKVTVLSTNDTDANAKADGSTTDAAATGVGVGIAINVVSNESNRALIGANTQVTAKALTVDAHMSVTGDGTNVLKADAISGAGSKETGVAGSLAINATKLSTEAVIAKGALVTLNGGDLTLNAGSKSSVIGAARPGLDPNTGGAKGVGLSFAVNVIEDGASAEVEDLVPVLGAKNVSVSASTTDDLNTVAQTGIQAKGSAFAAAAAITVLNSPTTARIGTLPVNATLNTGGNVSLTATHGGLLTSTSGGAADGGSDTTVGASVAVAVTTSDTVAKLARDVNATGEVTLTSKNSAASDAIAKASAKGGKADDGSAPKTAADNEAKSDLAQADSAAGSVGAKGTNGAKAPKAETSSGGLAAAGAFAIDIVTSSRSEASIDPNRKITSGGIVSIQATNDTDARARADASATSATSDGVGVAIALSAAPNNVTRASIGANSTVTAKGLFVQSSMTQGGDGTNTFSADALSGAGAKETGFAGAVAIGISKVTNEAYVGTGTTLNLSAPGDIKITADGKESSTVTAKPLMDGATGETKGIGVSFALNIVEDNTRSEIEKDVKVLGARDVTIRASSNETMTTAAQAGGQSTNGGTGFGAGIAIAVLNAPTTAQIGTLKNGEPTTSISGKLDIGASHISAANTTAGGTSSSTDTAVGASAALTFTTVNTVATTLRDVNATGDVTIHADSASASDSKAVASAKGGKPAGNNPQADAVDKAGKTEQDKADQQASAAGVGGTNGATAPKAKNDDGLTVAGALAINVAIASRAEASIPSNLTVTSSESLTLSAKNDTDAHAGADATAVDAASDGVGVAIGINAATNVITRATIAPLAHVKAKNLSVTADTGHGVTDTTNSIGADALSGAGAKETGFAGSLAINIAKFTTEATIDNSATANIGGGDVLLSATNKVESLVSATPSKDGATGKDKGVGVSAGFNIVEDNTTAELVNNATITGAKGIHLEAKSDDLLTTKAETGAQSTGGTAFAGSFAASALTSNTKARLGSGAGIAANGDIVVESAHIDVVTTSAGGEGKGAEKAIGVSLALTYENVNTIATTDRDINKAVGVTFSATSATAGETIATASETGAAEDPNAPADGARQTGDAGRSSLNEKASDAGVKGSGANSETPDAKTANGDSIAFAGAIALDIVPTARATATIPDGRKVNISGPLKLTAANQLDAHAKADGSAKGDAKTGVGVGLAITVAPDTTTLATIGNNVSVTASGVTLEAGMSGANDDINLVASEAVSGASASDKAGAGALALTVFTPTTIATIGGGSKVDLLGGNLNLAAIETTQSAALATPGVNKADGKSLGVGLSFAFNIVEPTTTAEIPDTVVVNNPGNVHVLALSNDVLLTVASTGAAAPGDENGGGTGFAASVGASALTSKTTARIGSGQKITTTNGGSVVVEASHKDLVKTIVGAQSTGSDTAVGVSFALGYESVETIATTDRDIDAQGMVTFAAHNASSTDTSAMASGVGGKAAGAASNAGVKNQGDKTRSTLNSNAKAADPGAQGADPNAKIPDAKNADNGSVAFAGAIALDLPVKVHSLASIPDNRSVRAGGLLTVSADNDVDARSKAEGTAVGNTSTGVGVAVAITIAPDVKTQATIGNNDVIQANGVNVSATMSPIGDGVNTVRADAISGASASDKAVAGAFAMNIFLEKTDATIGLKTPINAGNGDVTLNAIEATDSTVNAVPAVSNGGPGMPADTRTVTGVGVAVALNIVEIEAKAALANEVVVTNAHDVKVHAQSTDNLHTTATAGNAAQGQAEDLGLGGEAAISIFVGKTDATVGANGSITASGDIEVSAKHVDTNNTIGDGFGAGKGTALGIAIGVGYVDAQTTATVGESITAGGKITIDADNATSSFTSSTASAVGAKDKEDQNNNNPPQDSVDVTGQKNRDLGDTYAADYGGQKTDPNKKNPEAKTSGGSIAVAGALAINVVGYSRAIASTADGKLVQAGGPVSITAENDTDALAAASGSATGQSTKGVGVAVAINVAPTVETSATVGANSVIEGQGITIASGMSSANNGKNIVGGVSTSGASASEKAGAGALGLSLFFPDTQALAKTGAKLDAKGGNVLISSDSKTESTASALPSHEVSGKSIGVGVSVAIGAIEETTNAEVQNGATIFNAKDLTVHASSIDSSTVTAEAGATVSGGDAGTGAAALSVVIPKTTARVGLGVASVSTGDVTIEATHGGNTLAKTEGDSKGGDTVVGIAIAVNYLEADTKADIARNMTAGKSFTISAHTESSGTADAKASAGGAKGDDGNAPSNGVDTKVAGQRDSANSQIADNGGQKAQTNDDTSAKTSKGGVSVAGAIGLNIMHVHSDALIPDNLTVNANGGKLTVSAWNDADGTAKASGEATGTSKTGVGVAIAINYADATAHASIGDDTINAQGVLVEATQGNGSHSENYTAEAKSGAGATETGVAGSLALNIVKDNTHDARIKSGANVHAGDGNVSVIAAGATNDTARAVPVVDSMFPNDGGKTGVGVSLAANVVLKTTHAEIEDGAQIHDVAAFKVHADSANVFLTEAKTGSKGSETAVGISAGVFYAKDDVLARVGTGDAINALFDAEISAHIDDKATTTTSAAEVGSDTAVGISIAVGILRITSDHEPALPFTATSALNRDITTGFGTISVTTDARAIGDVSSTASVVSIPEGFDNNKNSDDQSSDQFGFLNGLSGQNESSSSSSVASNEQTANGATTSNANSQSQTSTGVAATIAVNVELVNIGAYVAPNTTLTTLGAIDVHSTSEVDGSATALGVSIALQDSSTTVSAAVAVNVPFVENHVVVGHDAHFTGQSITVAADQIDGTTDDFKVRALAGSGGGGDSGAGAAGINVVKVQTTVAVGSGAVFTSKSFVDVIAENPIRYQNWVGGVAVGDGTGVGIGVALNLVLDHSTTALVGHNATIDAPGTITVSADASLSPIENSGIPGDPGSLSFGGTGTSGTAVAGSILVDVMFETTYAVVAPNAKINTNVGVGNLGQSVIVTATDTVAIRDGAGGLSISTGGNGVGAGLLVSVLTKETRARIGSNSVVNAGGDVIVSSESHDEFFGLGVAATIAKGAAVSITAEVFVPNIITTAEIDANAVVNAMGNVVVKASDDVSAKVYGGAVAASTGSGGFGAQVAVLGLTVLTEAFIGPDSKVTARGRTQAVDILTGDKDSKGKPITQSVRGIGVSAVTFEDVLTIAAGGSAADTAAVAGSVAVDVLNLQTLAHIDHGTILDATDGKPGSGPSVHVLASDHTGFTSAAGSIAVGGNAAVGLAVNVGTINKHTIANSDAVTTTADRDVIVKADSSESLNTFGISGAASGGASVIAAASVDVLDITTRAYVGGANASTINASGNVQVAARESLDLLNIAGGIAVGSTAGIGAAAGIPIVSKTTEAYIGSGSTVNALGQGGTIDADTGRFVTSYDAQSYTDKGLGDVGPSNPNNSDRKYAEDKKSNTQVGLTPGGQLSGDRSATPETRAIRGVAVTATNRDDVIVVGASGGAGGTAAVNVSGAVNVFTNLTTAHVDSGVQINTSANGAVENQSVQIAAGSDLSFLGIAAALSAAGSAAVSAGAAVLVANETTTAYSADSTRIDARGDIVVEAHNAEDTLTIAATLSGSGGVSVTGAASVVVINSQTQAHIGINAESDATGAQARAHGNILIAATDNTTHLAIAGGLAIGGAAGVGVSAGITVFNKDTAAFSANHSFINADGVSAGIDGIAKGTIDGSTGAFDTIDDFHGVAIQALSSEQITQVGAAAGGGYLFGIGGGVSVEFFNAKTQAYVGDYARVNTSLGDRFSVQSVNIAALDSVKDFSLGAGGGGGIVGVGAGIDVGVVRNDTTAYVGQNAIVVAKGDIDVIALSNEDITTYAVSGAGGLGGLAGSVSIWSIGTAYSSSYHDDNGNQDSMQGSDLSSTLSGAETAPSSSNAVTGTLLDSGNGANQNPLLGPTKGTGNARTKTETTLSGNSQAGKFNGVVNAPAQPHGTSAIVHSGAKITAGGDINVLAADRLVMNVNVVSVGIGVVGFGASIAVVSIHGQVHADVLENVTLSAGDDITVRGIFTETFTGLSITGAAGGGAFGGQIILVNDDSVQTASIGSNSTIIQADDVSVIAGAGRFDSVETIGINVGLATGAVTFLEVNLTGSTTASIGNNVLIGASPERKVSGNLLVEALASNTIKDDAFALSVGLGTVAGHHASTTITPNISASIGNNTKVLVGGSISVGSLSLADAKANILNFSGGGVSLALMHSNAVVSPTISATVGNSTLTAGDSISVFGSHNYGPSGPLATLGAHAHSDAPGGGVITATGVIANAESNATVASKVAHGANLTAGNDVSVSSKLYNAANLDSASDAVGAIAVGAILLTATADGQADAWLDGTVHAGSVHVTTDGSGVADSKGTALGAALLGSGQVASVSAHASPKLNARLGGGGFAANINAENDIVVSTTDDSKANAEGMAIAVSGGFSFGLVLADATSTPDVSATVSEGSKITSVLGAIAVSATHNAAGIDGATATGDAPAGGLEAISGTKVSADASSTVAATVGTNAVLATRGPISVTSLSNNNAKADARALSFGALAAVGGTFANAYANGSTVADLDGDVQQGGSLTVTSDATNVATTHADATGGSLALALTGALSVAQAHPTTVARIGDDSGLALAPTIEVANSITLGATSMSNAESHAMTTSVGGLAGLGIAVANADSKARTTASVGKFADVNALGGSIDIFARHNTDGRTAAYATAEAPGGGIISGQGAVPSAHSQGTTEALVGQRSKLTAKGDVLVTSDATGIVGAEAHTVSLGFAGLGSTVVNATSDGSTETHMNGQVDANNATISAHSIDSAIADGTATTAGFVSGSGVDVNAIVNTRTIAEIGDVVSTGSVKGKGNVTLSASAEENAKATAKAVAISAATALPISHANAVMTSVIGSEVHDGSSIVTGGSIAVNADLTLPSDTLSAEASADSPGGSIGLTGSGAKAEATSKPSIYARSDAKTTLNGGSTIGVTADSVSSASATTSSLAIGAGALGSSIATAESSATTEASLLGKVETGLSLTVASHGNDRALTMGEAAAGGIVAGNGTFATSIVSPSTTATLGMAGDASSRFHLIDSVTVDATEKAFARSEAGSIAAGFVAAGLAGATSTVTPTVEAKIARLVTVKTDGGDITVNADFSGPSAKDDSTETIPTEALAHATGASLLGGYTSTKAEATLTPNVSAHADRRTTIDSGGNLVIAAHAHSTASTLADQISVALGVGTGGSSAGTTIGGTTSAYTFQSGSIKARNDIQVTSDDDAIAHSESHALGGGILGGVAGDVAVSDVTRSVSATLDTDNGPVEAFGAIKVHAKGESRANSLAKGIVGSGGISFGISEANSQATSTVTSLIGEGTHVTALKDVMVEADGTAVMVGNSVTSAGGAGAGEGSEVVRSGTVDVESLVGAGASIRAKTIDIGATSSNRASGSTSGNAGGAVGVGNNIGTTDLVSTTIARTLDTDSLHPTYLKGTDGIAIHARGEIEATTSSTGGAGGLFAGIGGVQDILSVHHPLVMAGLGSHTTAESDGELNIAARGRIDISSTGDQNGGGIYADEEAASTATVDDLQVGYHFCDDNYYGELLLAEIGEGAIVNVGSLNMSARHEELDGNVLHVKAYAHAKVELGVTGSAIAHSTAYAYTNSIVHIGSGANITALGDVNLRADGPDSVVVDSFAEATFIGVGSTTNDEKAANHSIDCVVIDDAAIVTAANIDIFSGPSNAYDGEQHILENGSYPPSQNDAVVENDSCSCNSGQFFLSQKVKHTLRIGSDGTINALSNVIVADADGVKSLGDKIRGSAKVETVRASDNAGTFRLHVGSDTEGHSLIHFNPYGDVDFVNESPFDLDLGNISTIDDGRPDVIVEQPEGEGTWTYDLLSTPGAVNVSIVNHNPSQNIVILRGSILAPTGDVTIDSDGGIYNGLPDRGGEIGLPPAIYARAISLKSSGGQIGGLGDSLRTNIFPTATGPDGIHDTFGENGVYLEPTFFAEAGQDLTLGDIHAGIGEVVVFVRDTLDTARRPVDTTWHLGSMSSREAGVIVRFGSQEPAATNDVVIEKTIRSDFGIVAVATSLGSITSGGADQLLASPIVNLEATSVGTADAPVLIDLGKEPVVFYGETRGDLHVRAARGGLRVGIAHSIEGDVDLSTGDTDARGEDIVLGDRGRIASDRGNVLLHAGDDVRIDFGSTIDAAGMLGIWGDFDNADTGVGSAVTFDGSVSANAIMIVTGEDSDAVTIESENLNAKALDVLLGDGDDRFTLNALGRSTAATIDGEDGDDLFTIGSIGTRAEGVAIPLILGGTGSNTLSGPDVSNRWNITRANEGVVTGPSSFKFVGVQNLKGGRLDDVFAFADGASLDGTVDGGEGINGLDFTGYRSEVDVDFRTNAVTGINGGLPGGFVNIDEVILPDGTKKKR